MKRSVARPTRCSMVDGMLRSSCLVNFVPFRSGGQLFAVGPSINDFVIHFSRIYMYINLSLTQLLV